MATLYMVGASVSLAQTQTSASRVMESDGLSVAFDPKDGLAISLDATPFSSNGSLHVVAPRWSQKYYGYELDSKLKKKIRREAPGEAPRMSFALGGVKPEFEGQQTIELLPNRVLRIAVDARLTSSVDARIEHMVAGIYPGWLTGRPYTYVDSKGKKHKGNVPTIARSEKLKDSVIARDFRSLRLETRLGPVEIVTTGSVPLSLVDYRKNCFAIPGQQYFWFGALETPLKGQTTTSYELEIRFPAKVEPPEGAVRHLVEGVTSSPGVLRPREVPDRIIPTPKKIQFARGDFRVTTDTAIFISAAFSEDGPVLDELTTEIQELVASNYRVSLKAAAAGQTPPKKGAFFMLRLTKGEGFAPEGYRIKIGDSVLLEAGSPAGMVSAIKSLRQLFRERSGQCVLRQCEIEDYPAMPLRGVLFFTGKDGRDAQTKMLRDVLGLLKVNTLLYHCSFIDWQSHPELHSEKYGMDKEDARAVAEEARRQHIQTIPYIPLFGLEEWLHNAGLPAEVRKDASLKDPASEKVRAVCMDVLNEAIELFHPRFFHIGHDELSTATEPLLENITYYHDYLTTEGIQTMVWSDLLLGPHEGPDATNASSPQEAAQRRSSLPKDVIVCDWHYAPAESNPSLKIFCDAGFDTVACPWYQPRNILNLARAVSSLREVTTKTLGLIDTTWAGWNFNGEGVEKNLYQYAAYVLAAEAAWTGGMQKADKVPFDYYEEFLRLWNKDLLPQSEASGWMVDLSPAATLPLKPSKKISPWLGYAKGVDLADFAAGDSWLGRFRFRLPSNKNAVLFSGRMNPDGQRGLSQLNLAIENTAKALVFAGAATLGGPEGQTLARTRVSYSDGSSETFEWKLAQNVFALDDTRMSLTAPVVWSKKARSGMRRAVHAYVWENPHPEKAISEIVTTSANEASALILFGVSGIQ